MILISEDVVLQISYFLAFVEVGVLALTVKELQGRFVLQDFIMPSSARPRQRARRSL